MRHRIIPSLIISLSLYAQLIDLEEAYGQDMIVQTKRIIIPQYPSAFNPSLVRWKNKIIMSFRIVPDPHDSFISYIGLIVLNDNFEPIGVPQLLDLRDVDSPVPSRAEDGRLLVQNQKLYLIYSDNDNIQLNKGGYRMYIAQILWDGKKFVITQREKLIHFEGNNPQRREKNWVPFTYNNNLLLAYSLHPHRILYPIEGTQYCETFVCSAHDIPWWKWGELRGGTPALLDDEHYLAFFHSSKKISTIHSAGKLMPHYFIGAYIFSKKVPFAITHVSEKPIIGKFFYHGASYKPYWGPVRAVFPCGYIMDNTYIWLSYGRQDHEMWVAQLDKKKLYASLRPVIKKRSSSYPSIFSFLHFY